ncbi:MAG: DUF4298 domain-containing protein [Lachnospiraceae bacterium]|nr:DUF4298 domain-containing protein [Lachnospiraceae bacterium]
MSYLEEHYNAYDEDGRLLSRHGQVEYLTTMKYIRACLSEHENAKVLEVGAGTGRYSVTLAKEGYNVTAVELIPHNLEILKSKLDGSEPITAIQGNALDLSEFADDSFDVTMLLGPMYHLYTLADRTKAMAEAVRVTKQGGHILVAYCMNEPTVVSFVFGKNNLKKVLDFNMLTEDWHCISEPKDLFQMVRTEEIAALDAEFPVERIKLVATDGATNYMADTVDAMDDETFEKWMEYHLLICERQDLLGASHHTLDILRKSQDPVIRVRSMEAIFDKASALAKAENVEELLSYKPQIQRLEDYYSGPLWKKDFEADEAGKFPADLKRGVLSEDGIYNLLECIKEFFEEHNK